MFGYIKTDVPNMYVKDTVLYKAMYCGLCKSLAHTCGCKSRFLLSYDLTFLSLLLHNVINSDVVIKKERCAVHWLTKRPVAQRDELTERIAALNVLLACYKIKDDITDEHKGGLKDKFFGRAFKKAKKKEPQLDEIIKTNYKQLVKLENCGCDSVDISADPFGKMIRQIVTCLAGDNNSEDLERLSYNLGKWIYLIDALDDIDKDVKKKNYNVFTLCYKVNSKKELIDKNGSEIKYIFTTILSDIKACSEKIEYNFNHDLSDNILICGIKEQTKKVMENKK